MNDDTKVIPKASVYTKEDHEWAEQYAQHLVDNLNKNVREGK